MQAPDSHPGAANTEKASLRAAEMLLDEQVRTIADLKLRLSTAPNTQLHSDARGRSGRSLKETGN